MLIEVKAKVSWIVDSKVKRKQETYIMEKEVFAQAEYAVMSFLTACKNEGTVEDFEITALKMSVIKEIITQYQGEQTFIITLRDTMLMDDGTEKQIKYKALLWADNISDAMSHARETSRQGYNMQIDGIKEVNYTYLNSENYETSEN